MTFKKTIVLFSMDSLDEILLSKDNGYRISKQITGFFKS